MIERINKINGLGIFKPIEKSMVSDFKRYNLIYGWNGSGKSTLSRLFALLGKNDEELAIQLSIQLPQMVKKLQKIVLEN